MLGRTPRVDTNAICAASSFQAMCPRRLMFTHIGKDATRPAPLITPLISQPRATCDVFQSRVVALKPHVQQEAQCSAFGSLEGAGGLRKSF